MPLTLDQAKALGYGDMLHSTINRNADGTCQRWKVSGTVQRWKRSPDRIRVPLKHGLRSYDSITDSDFHNGTCEVLTLASECDCGQAY